MQTINIIHNPNNKERGRSLSEEIERQTIAPFLKFWPAVYRDKPCTGISQAHKQIVRHAKEWDFETVWIIEDDIKIDDENGLKNFHASIPDQFDIYLGGASHIERKGQKITGFCGLHCYILHKRAYDRFLSADENLNIDYALSQMGLEIVLNSVSIQYPGYSENTGKFQDYSNRWQ